MTKEQLAWGKGYDVGQMGMMQAIKTAELLAKKRERDRIIGVISDYILTWQKPASLNFRRELMNLIERIENGN